jgi:hypothetical protein
VLDHLLGDGDTPAAADETGTDGNRPTIFYS